MQTVERFRAARWARAGAGAAAILAAVVGTASGQSLELKERPAAASLLCERTEAPTCDVEAADEIERLVNAATQAMILGDLSLATEFLTQALERDPCAAEAAYLRGRIAAQTEGTGAATEWFCRYLTLEPYGPSAPEARRRLEGAVQEGAATNLLASFSAGVSRYRAGEMARADEQFTSIIERQPVPEAVYNRALARIALERPDAARFDLERYLALRPQAPDRTAVAEALAALDARRSSKSAVAAFFLGALLPGGGQYYTGRTLFGLGVTGLVGGAAATGYLYERVTVNCRVATTGECPPDQIASRETERPLLIPALAVGGGIMLVTAIEAAVNAAGDNPPLSVAVGGVGTLRLDAGTRIGVSARGLDLHLVSIRH